jgi:hypothetical protein
MHIRDIIDSNFEINSPSDLHSLIDLLEDEDLQDEFLELWNSIGCGNTDTDRSIRVFSQINAQIFDSDLEEDQLAAVETANEGI